MIAVCEAQCKVFSHEKVNSGFLNGLRLAFPGERIVFYADPTHIAAIQACLKKDNIVLSNIDYIPISFSNSGTMVGFFKYYWLFKNMFINVLAQGSDKIFFLSFNAEILYLIKKLKTKNRFEEMKFTLVLHGSFEHIATGNHEKAGILLEPLPVPASSFSEKLRKTKAIDWPRKFLERVLRRFSFNVWAKVSAYFFTERAILLWRHCSDFRYIALSPHILPNAASFIDVDKLNIYTIVLPTNFSEPLPQPANKYVKFGVFGYGNSTMLYNIGLKLAQKKINGAYEIIIIGMDNRGTEGFDHMICPSPGKPLSRDRMEELARDIDVFLILYDKTRYRLSCSGSILESLSYMKPILSFDNDCINYFNNRSTPIGITCTTLDEYAQEMCKIIENYPAYKPIFEGFRGNITNLRERHSVANSSSIIRKSFVWETQ